MLGWGRPSGWTDRSSGCCKTRSGVVYVAMDLHVCCKCMFQMFQLFQTYVASLLPRILHKLQWLYTYIASVYFKCFICFRLCCSKYFMLQVFHKQAREVGAGGHHVHAGSEGAVGSPHGVAQAGRRVSRRSRRADAACQRPPASKRPGASHALIFMFSYPGLI
jgi:hypothetical protein